MEATVLSMKLCTLQVCVPREWSDEKIEQWANMSSPTGISSRWAIPSESMPNGDPRRRCCADDREKLHIVLEC